MEKESPMIPLSQETFFSDRTHWMAAMHYKESPLELPFPEMNGFLTPHGKGSPK